MNRKILVFDLDGTIINSKKSIINSFNLAFKKNNLKQINENFFINNASRGSRYLIKKNIKKSKIDIEKLNYDFHKIYEKKCEKNVSCRIGVRWFLKKYKKKYIFIICTNKKTIYAKKILKNLKIKKYFLNIYGSDFFNYKKPSKKLFIKLQKEINSRYQYVIIGDSEIDYKFAKNSRIKFILIKKGYTSVDFQKITQKFAIDNFFQLNKFLELI